MAFKSVPITTREFLGYSLGSKIWVLRDPPPLEDMIEDHEFYGIEIVSEKLPEIEIEDLAVVV